MNRIRLAVVVCACLLIVAGCSRKAGIGAVSVDVSFDATRVSGAAVKVVEQDALIEALVSAASRASLGDGIPASLYNDFFQTLSPAKVSKPVTTDADGKASLSDLQPNQFVVVHTPQYLWVASAGEVRDGKFVLNSQNQGGRHAVASLASRPELGQSVAGRLRSLAEQMVNQQQYDAARNLAGSARAFAEPDKAAALLVTIDRQQAEALLENAVDALAKKDFESARNLAVQARSRLPEAEHAEVLAVLKKILEEQGGELLTVAAHSGAVTGVAFAPDGTHVVTGGDDNAVKLWDVPTGKEVRAFTGHTRPVRGVAVSLDGASALSASDDGTLRLWAIDTGSELRALGGLGWKMTCVAISPDGRTALAGKDDNTVALWDLGTGRELRRFGGHGWKVTSVAYSSDGRQALSGSEDDSFKLWNVATGAEVRTFRNGFNDVNSVAFSSDGRFALSGGSDKLVKHWNLATGKELAALKGHNQTVTGVAFSANGRFAVSAGADGTIRFWNLEEAKEIHTLTNNSNPIVSLAVSSDGRLAATGSKDGTLKLWQLPREVWQ